MAVKRVTLPPPHAEQIKELLHPARFKVSCHGRRWGKSVMGLIAIVDGHGPLVDGRPLYQGAVHGRDLWWVAPTYKDTIEIWELLKHSLQDAWIEKKETERRIILPGGGSASIRSADDPYSLRSYGLDGVVVDEAAFIAERTAWGRLRAALADRRGWAWFISTPKGRKSWFYDLYVEAEEYEDWGRWQGPTSTLTVAKAELDVIKAQEHPTIWRQEYLAEFVDLGGEVFKREWFRKASSDNGTLVLDTPRGARGVDLDRCWKMVTVDLAASSKTTADYTVVSTWTVTPERDLVLSGCRRARLEGPEQLTAIEQAFAEHRPRAVFVESVAYQLTAVQHLRARRVPVYEHRPVKDKVARALTFGAMMCGGQVYFDAGVAGLADLLEELAAFPNGKNDDFVDTGSMAADEVLKRPRPRAA